MSDKILIADDEPDTLNLAKMLLAKGGYGVVTASSGEEALQKAEAEIPDLILLDVVMPGKSGLEVCKILKDRPRTRHVPVVMFTVLGRDVDRKLSTDAGANGHFLKPFTSEDLRAVARKHIDQVRGVRFSMQLGFEHAKLVGKKLLVEFDPSTPYERFVRDFALESVMHNEEVIVLTKKGSSIRQALEGEKGVEFIDLAPDVMLSSILEKHSKESLSMIFDNLTDLALSANAQAAYKFARNAIEMLSPLRVTALFLLNPAAHDPKDTYSLRGLFSDQVTFGKQGVVDAKIA